MTFAKKNNMSSAHLIQTLLEQTRQIINQVESLKYETPATLTWKTNEQSWNILECLEHLNLFGQYYLPEMEHRIKTATAPWEPEFKSGILGNYFAQSMLPKEKLNKMKTFKDKNPINTPLNHSVVETFLEQQFQLINLLNESRKVSLNKVRIPTSISRLLRLKLGDTFQFYVNHIIRHLHQIERIKASMN